MTTSTPALPAQPAARPIPRLVRALNPVVRRLLALGMPMGPNVLITVRGRKTGTPYTFPVAILETGGRRFLFSPFGEVAWVHNLAANGSAVVRRGRRVERFTAVRLTPEDAASHLEAGMRDVLGMPLFGAMIAGWYEIDGDSTPADYLASARVHPAFELIDVAADAQPR